ncbi:MAG: hypothetical protein ACXIUQ_12625 [Cecembia sp.]
MKTIKIKHDLAFFSIMMLGLVLFACNSAERRDKRNRRILYEQKEFRTFSPDKSSREVSPSPTLAYQSYIQELERTRQQHMARLDSIQEIKSTESENINMRALQEIFLLKKQGVALKSRILQIRNLTAFEFNAERTAIQSELDALGREIERLIGNLN